MAKEIKPLPPQSGSYTKKADKKKSAKPRGYRYTSALADKLNKSETARPTSADIEKYLNKKNKKGEYVYYERRADKSDAKPKEKFAKGGKAKQTAPQSDVYNEFRDLTKKAKPVGWRYTAAGAKALKKDPYSKPSQTHIDKYGESKYLDFETRADKTDEKPNQRFAKGGSTKKQTAPQGDNWSPRRDKQEKAKPVGYRYTQKLADRLGIRDVTRTPSQAHVEKYADKKNGIYWEGRKDKSDMNPKSYFAKGGVAEHGLREGDKIVSSGYDYIIVENGNQTFVIDIRRGERSKIQGNSIGAVIKNPKSHEEGGETEYAKGGQAPSYKQTYFGHEWKKKNDKEEKAKPVGYRYTEKLAKRLGKSPYAKVTPEHKEKYLGRGVYFENRKDKSDINPNQKLASGGKVKQTEPQSDVYNEFRDLTKSAKPVGWRYTNLGAEKLKVDPYAKPSKAHIEKYANSEKGYLDYETRLDKSDEKPKAKFEDGGDMEYAKGGVARISNSEASSYAENHQPFKGNNLEAKNLENGDYVILSYGYYPIWYWNKKENKWYQNKEKFSQTTARHISSSRPTFDAEVVSRAEMDKMMAQSLEGHGFMAMGGDVAC